MAILAKSQITITDLWDGIDGAPGTSSYFHVKYSPVANPTSAQMSDEIDTYIGTYVDENPTDSTDPKKYQWIKIEGLDGTNGVPGKDGVNGQTSYLHIKYSDNVLYDDNGIAHGSFTENNGEVPGAFIGQYVDFLLQDSSDFNKYKWYKVKGEVGPVGPQGVPGKATYTWVKYADDANGTNMSDSPTGKEYIGMAYNKDVPTESSVAKDYIWAKFKGSDGIPGAPGVDGKTYYTWLKYADTPTTGMSDSPDGKKYMGVAYNKTTQTESTSYSDYSWSLIKGADGIPGITYYTWIRYADDANGGGISNSPVGKSYIGFAYQKTSSTESNTPGDYKWSLIKGEQGVPGLPGANGQTTYTWIKYSDSLNPTTSAQIYDVPKASTMTIGIAVNKTTATEGTTPSDYTWSRFKGETGATGAEGVAYTINITGGTRGIAYAADGTEPSPATSTEFTAQLLKNGKAQTTISSCSWSVGGVFTSGTVGSTNLKYTPRISTTVDTKNIPSTFVTVSIKPSANEEAVVQTVPIVVTANADGLDWLADWNSGKTTIKDKSIASPRIFAGENTGSENAPVLSGVALGKDVLAGSSTQIGLVGYQENRPTFKLGTDGTFLVSKDGSSGGVVNGGNAGIYFDGTNLSITGNVSIKGGSIGGSGIADIVNGANAGTDAKNGLNTAVKAVDVEYAINQSATTKPTSGWQTEPPDWKDGWFIWSRTTTTLVGGGSTTTEPVCITGAKGTTGSAGKGITSTTITYQASSSGTTAPTGTWSPSVPSLSAGQYLWTRTVIAFTDNTSTTSYSVSRSGTNGANGTNGADGKGIKSTAITYQASASGTVVPTGSWGSGVPTVPDGQYLWTRTIVTYTDNSTSTSYSISKMGVNGTAGKGISAIQNYYLATSASSGVTVGTSGWTTTMQSMTTTNKYLWNYEKISYTTGNPTDTTPVIIGVHGTNGANGSNGTDGRGIVSIVEYYLVSPNSTGVTTSTSGWNTTIPTMTTTNRYLWNYEVINYTTGSPTTGSPKVIGVYGATGSTGATGQGIESITEEYYLSTSKTTQTGGSWVTTPPGWSTGKYMWTRSKIVYKNPTDTAYTTPICDSSWEAVNDVQVGGRNLISTNIIDKSYGVNSTEEFTVSSWAGMIINTSNTLSMLNEGETYTLSYDMELITRCNAPTIYAHSCGLNIYSASTSNDVYTATSTLRNVGDKQRISVTFVCPPLSDQNFRVYSNRYTTNGGEPVQLDTIKITNLKLEKGNKATDWTPAPEDVDAAAKAAKDAADAAASAAKTANDKHAEAANDNKLTAIEKQQAKKEWDIIVGEKSKIDAEADKFAVSKTAYGTAYNNLNTYITPLLANLTTTSDITGTTYRANFKNYYDARQDILNAISTKAKSIADTSAELANAMSNGKMLYTDPNFRKGSNSVVVYNNSGGTGVTITRIAKISDCPSTSTHCLEIKTTGTSNPNWGGFIHSINSRANAVFIQKFVAKIPSGRTLSIHHNSLGTGSSVKWLTSNAGTGKWETYIAKIVCGSSGSFSSGGHISAAGGATPTTEAPLVWYLSYATVIDISDDDNRFNDLNESKVDDKQDAIFNRLFTNGTQGFVLEGGKVYINGEVIKANAISGNTIKAGTLTAEKLTVSGGEAALGNLAAGKSFSGTGTGTVASDGAKAIGSSYLSFGTGSQNNNAAESAYTQVDLGTSRIISESRVYFYSQDSRYYWYKIKYSTDGTNWYYAVGRSGNNGWILSPTPKSTATGTENPTINKFGVPIVARYLRLYGNGNNINTSNHIYEWELYSQANTQISGSEITTGTLNAGVVSVTNLNASNITTGTIAADRLDANTIVSKVNGASTTINGNKITTGTIVADHLAIGLGENGGYSKNPTFKKWGSSYPDGTSGWTDGGISKVSIDSRNVAQFVCSATSQNGMHLNTSFFGSGLNLDGPQYFVVECKFRLTSGTNPNGAAVLIDIFRTDSTYERMQMNLNRIGTSLTTNTWYSCKQVFKLADANVAKTFKQMSGYCLANWSSAGGLTAKTIQFASVNVYKATEQDYLTQTWTSGTEINGASIKTGTITANKLNVTDLTALGATIGGFSIKDGAIYSTNVGMGRSGKEWAFWAGSNTSGSAPFRVGHAGEVVASNMTITGGNITLSNGSMLLGNTSGSSYMHWTGSQLWVRAAGMSIGTEDVATKSFVTTTANDVTFKFSQSGGANLLKNGGFRKGNWDYWYNIEHNTGGTGKAREIWFNRSYVPKGKYVLNLRYANGSGEFGVQQDVYVKSNTNYTLSYWVSQHRCSEVGHVIRNSNGSWLAHATYTDIPYATNDETGGGYVKKTHVFNSGSNTTIGIELAIRQAQENGHAWFYDAMLNEGTVALPWSSNYEEVYNGSTVIDGSGVTINNGALRIKNNNGETVLSGDSNGNLWVQRYLVVGGNSNGVIEVKNSSNNLIAKMNNSGLSIKDGVVRITAGSVTQLGNGYPDGNPRDMKLMAYGTHIDETDYSGSQVTRRFAKYQGGDWNLITDNQANAHGLSYKTSGTASSIRGYVSGGNNLNWSETYSLNSETGQIWGRNFYLTGIHGTNGFQGGEGDNATWEVCNFDIRAWWGLGIKSYDGVRRILFNSRSGAIYARGTIEAGGDMYSDRYRGRSADNVYIGAGPGRVENSSSGHCRYYSSWVGNSDCGIYISPSGAVGIKSYGAVKHAFNDNGTKTGGTIEIEGTTYGMSPTDSPQTLIEYVEFDIEVDGETEIMLKPIYSKSVTRYAVFSSNPDIQIVKKLEDRFIVTGTGVADFNIKGQRIEGQEDYIIMGGFEHGEKHEVVV